MDTLYTFRDNITHYKTESVSFLGLMNSATKTKARRRAKLQHAIAPKLPEWIKRPSGVTPSLGLGGLEGFLS